MAKWASLITTNEGRGTMEEPEPVVMKCKRCKGPIGFMRMPEETARLLLSLTDGLCMRCFAESREVPEDGEIERLLNFDGLPEMRETGGV